MDDDQLLDGFDIDVGEQGVSEETDDGAFGLSSEQPADEQEGQTGEPVDEAKRAFESDQGSGEQASGDVAVSEEPKEDDRVYNLKREYDRKFENISSVVKQRDERIDNLTGLLAQAVERLTETTSGEKKEKAKPDPLEQRLNSLDLDDPDQLLESYDIRARLAENRAQRVEERFDGFLGDLARQREFEAQQASSNRHMQESSSKLESSIRTQAKELGLGDDQEAMHRVWRLAKADWAERGFSEEAFGLVSEVIGAELKFEASRKPKAVSNEALPPPKTAASVPKPRAESSQQRKKKFDPNQLDDHNFNLYVSKLLDTSNWS
tara:strand:+ start:1 stop:963 length:963 start_codon:yes stop_codon:yes gene_type:complete